MTQLAFDGSNPDVGLLDTINGLVRSVPGWLDGPVSFLGEYGFVVGVLALLVWCWWQVARRHGEDPAAAVAAVAWAGLSAVLALLFSVPIRHVVHRPRPFEGQRDLHVLLRDTSKYSFVSDHSALAMAVGVGLFVVHRRAGLIGIGLALLEGFTRVLMGDNYPTDVIGGLALGTATALLFAPLAMLGLVPLARAIERGRAAVLVRALRPAAGPSPADPGPTTDGRRPGNGPATPPSCGKDLAA